MGLAATVLGATLVIAMLMLVVFSLLMTVQRYLQHGSSWAEDAQLVAAPKRSLPGEAVSSQAESAA
jgi:hypothetical protein